jgi:hypothetical protein
MMTAQAAKLPWHYPVIAEHIMIMPPAGQLTISSSRGPRREHTDREREAQMNRERQARWRERDIDSKACDVVEWSGDVLTMLVETEYLDDSETGDSKAVAKAISEMLEDAAVEKAWRKRW